MALSYVNYTANGSTNQFDITFSYIDSSHVKVYVNGTQDTNFTFVNTARIQTSSTPSNGQIVKIDRDTPTTSRLVDFQDGSTLTENDLDKSANQNFFAVQETIDTVADKLGKATDGIYDAGSTRIKNVANPTSAQDVATKNYLENTWLSTSDKTNLTAVAAVDTEIGLLGNSATITDLGILGTADVVSDLNTLGTSDVVADLNTLGTADVVSDMNTLGTSSNVTNMNTLAGISSAITGVNSISSAVSAVNSNASNINAVAGDATDIGVVAGKATEIGRLGTSDAVADLAILGTSAIVADLAILGTTDVVADMNVLATSDVVADMNTLGTSDVVSDLNTLATSANVSAMGLLGNSTTVSNMGLLGTSAAVADMALLGTSAVVADMEILGTSAVVADMAQLASSDFISDLNAIEAIKADVETVADNVAGVNSFASRYRVASSDPSSNNDEGDLAYNTTSNALKYFNGSSFVSVTAPDVTLADATALAIALG